MRLSDTHLIILSTAAQRDGLVLPVPDTVRASPEKVEKALRQLLKAGLVCEQPAQPGQEAWRENEEGGRLALALTEAGKARISAAEDAAQDGGLETNEPSAGNPPPDPARGRRSRGKAASETSVKSSRRQKSGGTRAAKPSIEPAAGGKIGVLVKLFSRKSGASIDEAIKATGWQAHSVRGAISGALKKKHGLAIASEPSATRGRVYRIVR